MSGICRVALGHGVGNAIQGLAQALQVIVLLETLPQAVRDVLPGILRNTTVVATVCDDFDGMRLQQDVDQDAVVVLGIPDAELGKLHDGALAGAGLTLLIALGQGVLDADTNITGVTGFAVGDVRGQLLDGLFREQFTCCGIGKSFCRAVVL